MGQPILEVEHLKKSYVNNVPILDDVSFSMQKGEVIVIVGPSGCGKSTFLRCINRLEETDSGVLKLDGVSYENEKKNISKVREKIGMVFQSYDLFPNMTILNNLLLAPLKVQKRNKEEVKKEAEQLLDRVGLLDKKDSYPRQLSGGQKQRVAIVRAMLMHPEIMLLKTYSQFLFILSGNLYNFFHMLFQMLNPCICIKFVHMIPLAMEQLLHISVLF